MTKLPILSFPITLVATISIAGLATAKDAPTQPAAFAVCAGCHSVEPGKSSFGPNLRSVIGRKAGSLPGYAYSKALKASGIVWDAQTLDKWLTSPKKTVPGTKMPFPGYDDPVKRQQVIDYLMSLT
ncbi:MAG: c-type cytochrome [Novosphingobium sp.]